MYLSVIDNYGFQLVWISNSIFFFERIMVNIAVENRLDIQQENYEIWMSYFEAI